VESLLYASLVLVLNKESAAPSRSLVSILEEPEHTSLRELLGALAAHSPDFRSRLIEALGERNWLVHRSLQSEDPEPTLDSLRSFTARLQELARHLSSLKDKMLRSVEARCWRPEVPQ
jgi:hypothetical protein